MSVLGRRLLAASGPAVDGRVLRSEKFSSDQLRMPQIKKSRNRPVQTGASADDPDPVPREESRPTGDAERGGGGEEGNHGDSDIIKSPSDPKEYR